MESPVASFRKLDAVQLSAILAVGGYITLVAILAMAVHMDGQLYFALFDDEMISMRYAYNLAHGSGLVWNPNERIQGITNLGWTFIMALVHLLNLHMSNNSLVIQFLNLIFYLLLVSYVYVSVLRGNGRFAAIAATIMVAFNAPLVIQGINGCETTLQALLISLALLPMMPRDPPQEMPAKCWASPLFAALAFFIRPDGLLIYAVVSLIVLTDFLVVQRHSMKTGFKALALLSVAFGVGLIAATLFGQKLYFGNWLPNTYYLKASADTWDWLRGLRYVSTFAITEKQLPLLLGAVVALVWGLRNRETRLAYLPWSCAFFPWLLYIIWIGGDFFEWGRYFVPVIPLMAVATVIALKRCFVQNMTVTLTASEVGLSFRYWPIFGRHYFGYLLLALVAVQLYAFYFAVSFSCRDWRGYNLSNFRIVHGINRTAPPRDVLIGVYWAGLTPYFLPQYRFHDFLGKCDAHVAHSTAHWGPPGHNKWDYKYSLGQLKPDIIISAFPYDEDSDEEMNERLERKIDHGYWPALWWDPIFRKNYMKQRIELREGPTIECIFTTKRAEDWFKKADELRAKSREKQQIQKPDSEEEYGKIPESDSGESAAPLP